MSSRAVSSARTCRKAPIGIYVVSVPRSMNFELTYIKWYWYVFMKDMQVKQSRWKCSSLVDMFLSKDRVNNSIDFVLLLVDLIIHDYDSS